VRFAPVFDGRGQAYLGLNDPALALADFNTALEEDPHYGISYLHRAQAYEGLGQIEAALADYERFLGAYFVDDDGLRAYAAHQIEELESAAP
jgi:tetratricopeptide (TPR) repeat protein